MKLSDKEGRRKAERPLADDDAFLTSLNRKLREQPKPDDIPLLPILFTSGAPRSGTTILSQMVCGYFDVGYIDNLAAKFWEAPVTGLNLSRLTFSKASVDSRSYFGRTTASDIHGFHYFWIKHFKIGAAEDLFAPLSSRKIDWPAIRGHLAAMERVRDRPMVFKGYYPSYFMEEVCAALPTAVFVWVSRDPLAEGLSIYRARQAIMTDVSDWWSMHPPNVHTVLNKPVFDQIAHQVLGLELFFANQCKAAGGRIRLVRVKYEDLISQPEATLRRIGDEISALSKTEIPVRGTLLEARMRPLSDYPSDDLDKMRAALMRHQLAETNR